MQICTAALFVIHALERSQAQNMPHDCHVLWMSDRTMEQKCHLVGLPGFFEELIGVGDKF